MSLLQMSLNKAALRRFVDAVNTHDPDVISETVDDVFDPDVRIGTPMPIEAAGAEGIKTVFGSLHCAFPDLHLTIEDLIAEGDKVASRDTNSGTHRGAFMGVAATGKAVTYNEIFIARFAAGRIVESWAIVDALSLMRQLGLVPGGLGQSPLQADGGPASHPLPTSSR